jgi:hypothetical protein
MFLVKMVGGAPAYGVELDAALNVTARAKILVLLEWKHLGREQLDLQRHDKTVLGIPGAQADETFACFEHFASDERLQAVEIGEPVGVGLVRPVTPDLLQLGLQVRVIEHRGGCDARPHEGGDELLLRLSRIAIVDGEIT